MRFSYRRNITPPVFFCIILLLVRENRMHKPEPLLEIRTLGLFCLSMDGKPIATDWPDETLRNVFCSLLSPLDLYITWDRICRSMWGVPESQSSRRRLEETFIRPLNDFLAKELGLKPLSTGSEGIRMDRDNIYLDALEFHNSAIQGLNLLSLGDHAAALENFSRAKALYAGDYLPGFPGKIITNTRKDLESLYLVLIPATDDAANFRIIR